MVAVGFGSGRCGGFTRGSRGLRTAGVDTVGVGVGVGLTVEVSAVGVGDGEAVPNGAEVGESVAPVEAVEPAEPHEAVSASATTSAAAPMSRGIPGVLPWPDTSAHLIRLCRPLPPDRHRKLPTRHGKSWFVAGCGGGTDEPSGPYDRPLPHGITRSTAIAHLARGTHVPPESPV